MTKEEAEQELLALIERSEEQSTQLAEALRPMAPEQRVCCVMGLVFELVHADREGWVADVFNEAIYMGKDKRVSRDDGMIALALYIGQRLSSLPKRKLH